MSGEKNTNAKVESEGDQTNSSPAKIRQEIEEEFNLQRAKMMELFLQKEEDSRKMQVDKEQLESEVLGLRAELQQLQTLSENQKSEIQSLQLLVSETVEASSSGTQELRKLWMKNQELEQLVSQLKQQQQDMSNVPATFVRNLARKLGADTDDQPPRKNAEDGELLNSVIEPLETEITALKNKLRETDAQLQEALKLKTNSETSNSTGPMVGDSKQDTGAIAERRCDMCANYEQQLVREQARTAAASDKQLQLTQALQLATEELEGVRSAQEETVRSWQEWRNKSAEQLKELQTELQRRQEDVQRGCNEAQLASKRALHAVTTLTVQRETLQKKLDSLERDNEILVGRYTKKAEEMQNEVIDLPHTVEELHEYVLKLREQLIFCQIGREDALETESELRVQMLEQNAQFHRQEARLSELCTELQEARDELDRLQTEREQMNELADKLRHSNDMIEKLLEDKKRLQSEVHEVRSRVSVLQQELDNSEKVQQDFVRLSQSLQVQLQQLREADTDVRWQLEEDVSECPTCHTSLPNSRKKVHCRHCGRIFCSSCVSQTVPSGPRRVPARVCSVCATLLQPNAAPYFSTDAPAH